MSSPPLVPVFPPEKDRVQWCLDTTAMRDFLRLSRASVDDSISAHLNALLTPGHIDSFASSRQASQAPRGNRRNIPEETCSAFKQKVLFPGWSTRDSVFLSCSAVADSLDKSATDSGQDSQQLNVGHSSQSRNYWGYEQTVDERLDPYSARDYGWTRAPQAQQLREVLQNEASTEGIVRSRTWAVLAERCVGGTNTSKTAGQWHQEYEAWTSQ